MSHNEMITNQFGEQYLYAVNRGMFEQESALERIEREFGKLLAREDSLIIFIGSDSGNIIRYVLDRGLPQGTRYIFVEPEDILNQVAKIVDLKTVEDRLWLVTPEQFKEAAQEAGITNYMYVDGVFLKRCLSAEYGFFGQYRSEYWTIEGRLNEQRWNTTMALGGEIFIQRQLENCADNVFSISNLKGCLKNKTVIVLGGGPSLDDHLSWIKNNRDKLVVIAVSRICSILRKVELEPDFVFSMDPHDISYQVSKGMLDLGPKTIFINQYHVVPKLLSQWRYKKFFMGPLLPWASDLNPSNTVNGLGPTVTNAAIGAAAWMGSTHILLAGVDLCFTPEGHTHSDGSRERAAGVKVDLSSLTVETNQGEYANTTPDYASAARNISLHATALRKENVKLINLSSNAARMDNVIYQEPESIIFPSESGYIFFEDVISVDIASWLTVLKNELEDKKEQAKIVLELLSQAVKIHSSMYEGSEINTTKKSELEQIDIDISEKYPAVFKLIKVLSIRSLLRMAQAFSDLANINLEAIKKRLDIYYAALVSGAKLLCSYIDAGLDSVEVRQIELRINYVSDVYLIELVHRWIARGEPGRFLKFEILNEKKEILSVARKAFLDEMEYDHFAKLTQQSKSRNLIAIPARIQYLRDHGDINALETLKKSLQEMKDARAYIPLISATISQIRHLPEVALVELLPVMEQPDSPILEQALAMMVGLCTELGHHQAVMDAMAGLASLNAFYLNLYSDALMANGQVIDAIDHLAEYLHYFPGDKQALMKLKKWYAEQGSEEGVRLIESLLQEQMSD